MKIFYALLCLLLLAGCQSSFKSASIPSIENEPDYALLQQQLEKIYDLDQSVRNVNWDSLEADPAVLSAYVVNMWKTDTANLAKVLPIVDEYGWLPKSRIGDKASSALFLVIQHSKLEIIEQYLPLMEAQAQKGEASATNAAKMRDRLLMFQGKKQIYGTQASGDLRTNKIMAIWPIENADNVNKRRREAGFTLTVEENAKRLGAEYDPNGKLPKKKNN